MVSGRGNVAVWVVAALACAAGASSCGASTSVEPAAGSGPSAKQATTAAATENEATEPATEAGRPRPAPAAEVPLVVAAPEPPPEPPPPPRAHGVSGLLQAVPPLIWRHADAVEDDWYRIKAIADLVQQARELAAAKLHRTACKGLVDVRQVDPDRAPFGYRDDVRGRSWVRPVVAGILARALGILRTKLKDRFVTLGDLSQPGCGQLEHGALVRLVSDDDEPQVVRPGAPADVVPVGAATTLVNQARLRAGVPTVVQLVPGRTFRSEQYRVAFGDEPVLVETEILAQDRTSTDKLLLKTVSRRYRAQDPPTAEEVEAFGQRVEKLMRAGAVVEEREAPHWDAEHGMRTVWVQRWSSARLRRQMEVIALKKHHRRVDMAAVLEVREAQWQARKPGSFRSAVRWVAAQDGQGGQTWSRWRQLYEAGHITHLAGRDADISYVTDENRQHFRVDMDAIDVRATWTWFQAMDQAAREAGVAIDRIIVDRKVKRLLTRGLSKRIRRSKLWRTLKVVGGHDGHHHVRFTRATPRLEKRALQFLTKKIKMALPRFGLVTKR